MTERRYVPGNVDYYHHGRANCDAALTWTLTPEGCFRMSGEIWQPSKRDIVMGGQCVDTVASYFPDDTQVQRMRAIWQRWHLNDMRPGCVHQRQIDTQRKVDVVSYELTQAARRLRLDVLERASKAALAGDPFTPTATERALAELDTWYQSVYALPDVDSPLSGCYEFEKCETKTVNWVRPDEHADGLLGASCPECGYRYGTQWLHEALPPEVVAEIRAWRTTP